MYRTPTRQTVTEPKPVAFADEVDYQKVQTSSAREAFRTYFIAFGSSLAIVTTFSITAKLLFLT